MDKIKTSNLNTVLLAQVYYLVLAYSYNLMSIQRVSEGLSPLAKGNPQLLMILLFPFVVVTCVGQFGKVRAFYFLSIISSIALFIKGVLPHFQVFFDESYLNNYASKGAWLAAILINLFGVVCYVIGAINAKKSEQSKTSN
jgi:hypothetical protein